MLKKKYVKRAYIVLTSYPAQYPFECTNKDCDGRQTFREEEVPGVLR